MQTKSMFFAAALGLLLVGAQSAGAQVVIRGNIGAYGPPRVHYGPRYYYPPQPAVVYAVPPPAVLVVPAPYYAPHRYHAPRPYYYGHPGRGHGRRW